MGRTTECQIGKRPAEVTDLGKVRAAKGWKSYSLMRIRFKDTGETLTMGQLRSTCLYRLKRAAVVEKEHVYICVGGPFDGKRYRSKDGYGFRAPKLAKMPSLPLDSSALPAEAVQIHYVTYVMDRVRTSKDDEIRFWRPYEQSLYDTIAKLLERYEQSANIEWR